jgi:hypothetical protein
MWMTLASHAYTFQGATQLDAIMFQIARWLAHHLDKPELLRWVLKSGGSVHPTLCRLILDQLKTTQLPQPLVTIWKLVCAGFAVSGQDHMSTHNWIAEFKQFGWSASLRYSQESNDCADVADL